MTLNPPMNAEHDIWPPADPQQSRERLHLLASARCLLWSADVALRDDGRLEWTSRYFDDEAAQRLFPLPDKHGDHYMWAWHAARLPEDRDRTYSIADSCVRRGEDYRQEFRLRAPDGSVRHMQEDVHLEAMEAGKRWRLVGVCTDVTAYKEQEAALQESEERFRATFEQAAVGLAHVSLGGAWIRVNQRLCNILGYERAELLQRSFQEITHPDDLEADLEQAARLATGEIASYSMEKRYLRKDSSIAYVHLTDSIVRGREGEPLYYIAVVEDITERKRAAQAIRDSEARLAAIVGSAMDAVITIDSSQRIIMFNAAAEGMFGCSAEQAIGGPLDRFIPERYRRRHETHVQTFGNTGVTSRTMRSLQPLAGLRARGEEFPIEATISQVQVGGQSLYTVIVRDITARVRADEERTAHLHEIEALNERLRSAMSETHHRVKNNLQVISSLMEMQTLEPGDSVAKSEMRRLAHHIQALAAIHNLLTHQAKTDAELEFLSIRAALEQILRVIQTVVRDRPIRLCVAQDVRLPVQQTTALAVVVNEAIANALKHAPAGDIEIGFAVETGVARLAVADRGPGFPAGFDVTRNASTGLELIERLVAWDMQGTTRHENRPDGGASLIVEFPCLVPKEGARP